MVVSLSDLQRRMKRIGKSRQKQQRQQPQPQQPQPQQLQEKASLPSNVPPNAPPRSKQLQPTAKLTTKTKTKTIKLPPVPRKRRQHSPSPSFFNTTMLVNKPLKKTPPFYQYSRSITYERMKKTRMMPMILHGCQI